MRRSKAATAPPPPRAATRASGGYLAYGRQLIEDDDVAAVVQAMRGDLLTTGPAVIRFEQELARLTGAKDAVVCSNGTSALFIATRALGLGKGDTVIVPAITFVATASAPHLAGAEIVFSDVDPETGLMRACDLEESLARCPNGRAAAVFPVHYAGQSCDMPAIAKIARSRNMAIVEDAAHALGTAWIGDKGAILPVGANVHCDMTTFSFHPVKAIAMGEGGAVTANDPDLIARLRRARNHGLVREAAEFVRSDAAFDSAGAAHPWYYELEAPGFNFRISDINCALGLSQLAKLDRFVTHRRKLVAAYDEWLAPLAPAVKPLKRDARSSTGWHIYPVRIDFAEFGISRGGLMRALGCEGIGTQVHYIPVHRQPYYAARYGVAHLVGADSYYASTISLPLHVSMDEHDVSRVVELLRKFLTT